MSGQGATHGVPRWVKVCGIAIISVVPLMVVLHFIAMRLLGLASDDHSHHQDTPRPGAKEQGPHRP